jgi:hypothetical protein
MILAVPRPPGRRVYRLVTSILDPRRPPASELAVLYHQRWEIEGVLDELKTHQRGPRAVLRSKTPAMVEQEVWAHLLVHYAIRKLMHQAACDQGLDPAASSPASRSSPSPAVGGIAGEAIRFGAGKVTTRCPG